MMAGIKSKNTTQEIHVSRLPGKPELVLKKYSAVIDVGRCFWHGHLCSDFKLPATHTGFWNTKIHSTRNRDGMNLQLWGAEVWRVLVIWECIMKKRFIPDLDYVVGKIKSWLNSDVSFSEIPCHD